MPALDLARPSQAARYWQTLRHLRPIQFWWRLRLVVRGMGRPDLRAAPLLRKASRPWVAAERPASMTGPDSFRFLNEERTLAGATDWNANASKLWLYNAHYFDDLVAVLAPEREAWHRRLLDRWISENPPAGGNGWEPYPTALRMVNWIKWAAAGNEFQDTWRESLATQTRWLGNNVEFHLLGNHLLADAKALVFAGAAFSGREADGWLARGLSLLDAQLAEQVLPDGGHFERSPMYHATILEDVLDLVQLSMVYPSSALASRAQQWQATATAMLEWLRVMSHPDGGPAFFNDCAFGIAGSYAELCDYARKLGIEPVDGAFGEARYLAASGYFRLENKHAVVLGDLAPVGPEYQPGHAHADTLSFELSIGGQRTIVNGGTSTYDLGPERARQRGTAAHNTISIDDRNSSDVWAAFRVGRRARVSGAQVHDRRTEQVAQGSHDGYAYLPGGPSHARKWRLEPGRLTISDEITAPSTRAVARFRFAPGLRVRIDSRQGEASGEGRPAVRWKVAGPCEVSVEPGTWHPRFGVAEPCDILAISMQSGAIETEFTWQADYP